MKRPTQKDLRLVFKYDPRTGVFSRRFARGKQPAGYAFTKPNKNGHILISVQGRSYTAQQLVWVYLHDYWPQGVIVHKDGDKTNNRPGNIETTTRAEVARQAHARKKSRA